MRSIPGPIEDALDAHEAFVPTENGYALETTVFETTVTANQAEGPRDGEIRVTVRLPTLDAATTDHVASIVEDDWFETLERRLADVFSVAHTTRHQDPRLERDGDEVRVTLEYVTWDAREGVEDAKTIIEYVEGTFAQGLIPGYDYRGEAATLLENAQAAGDVDDSVSEP